MPELAAHVRDVPVNQIREITEAAWRTPGALVLSIGEPGFPLPRHVLDAGMACLDRDETNYTPNAGIPALREAFAARFRAQQGCDINADRVYVVDGAQQGLHFAMSLLLSPGDEILIPNPGYPTFAMTSRLLNAVPVGYPLYPEQGFQPRTRDIEALITDRTRVLVLNSPSNPLGAVLSEELTRELVEMARQHDLWVISDECYEAFTYDVPHVSPARFDGGLAGRGAGLHFADAFQDVRPHGAPDRRAGLPAGAGAEDEQRDGVDRLVRGVAVTVRGARRPHRATGLRPARARTLPGQPGRRVRSARLQGHSISEGRRRVLPLGGRVSCQRRGRPGLGAALPCGVRRGPRTGDGLRFHWRGLGADCAVRQAG
jgi:hypothetical protein